MFKSACIKSLFVFLSILALDAAAQGQRKLYKGQYHRGTQAKISLKSISRNELITLFVAGGFASYHGDLSGLMAPLRPQIGGSAILRTGYLGKRLSLRADVRCFRLYSADIYKDRHLNFRSTNWEFLALGQVDLFPYEKMMRRRTKINPYLYAGFGLMTFDPWGQLPNGKWHQLRPLQTEHVKYGNVAFTYTAGLGFKYKFSYRWNFMIEGGYRFTTTDYIDDVSSGYYPPASSFNNSISVIMSNKTGNPNAVTGRGSPKYKDGYFMFSAGITYTFTKHHAPKFHNDKSLLRKT